MNTLRDTEKLPVPSSHFNQTQLTSQHRKTVLSRTALYSKQYELGASIYVIQHLEQEQAEPQSNRTLKPHNIQYSL